MLPQHVIQHYSDDDWQAFTEEWLSIRGYAKVVPMGGSGDQGIDVAGYTDADGLDGIWDCFQCKRYDKSLTPGIAIPEIGKILWHTFKDKYKPPREYYFVAPKGVGTTLVKLLGRPAELKKIVIDRWADWVDGHITVQEDTSLTSTLKAYIDKFDFAIFKFYTPLEILNFHRQTQFYSVRFSLPLPPRPNPQMPPNEFASTESGYITQLLKVYSEVLSRPVTKESELTSELHRHFSRQRESFYSAESLKVFAIDSVPPLTYEAYVGQLYHGVIEACDSTHHRDKYTRMQGILQASTSVAITDNPLSPVVNVVDKKGMCHQLVNEDKIFWCR